MKRLIIGCDLDDVLNDQCKVWVQVLNFTHSLDVSYEDIKDWDISKVFPELSDENLYGPANNAGLVGLMRPSQDAIKYTNEWISRGHIIMVTTSTNVKNVDTKCEWLKRNYDWFTDNNLILTHKKQLVRGDVLVDDGIHNLLPDSETGIKPAYMKLCFDRPWNRSFDCEENGITRVHSFSEIDAIIKRLEVGGMF